jgi:hypothetical protein
MNATPEVAAILTHIKTEVRYAIENEVMSLSMNQLNALLMDYMSMKYKPSAEYTAIAETAKAELAYREARIHRSQMAEEKANA